MTPDHPIEGAFGPACGIAGTVAPGGSLAGSQTSSEWDGNAANTQQQVSTQLSVDGNSNDIACSQNTSLSISAIPSQGGALERFPVASAAVSYFIHNEKPFATGTLGSIYESPVGGQTSVSGSEPSGENDERSRVAAARRCFHALIDVNATDHRNNISGMSTNTQCSPAIIEATMLLIPVVVRLHRQQTHAIHDGELHSFQHALLLLMKFLVQPAAIAQQQQNTPQHDDILTMCLDALVNVSVTGCEGCSTKALATVADLGRYCSQQKRLETAEQLMSILLPQVFGSLITHLEPQLEAVKAGRLPQPGEAPLWGVVRRNKGDLLPASLSARVAGDCVYCILALNSRMRSMPSSLFQPINQLQPGDTIPDLDILLRFLRIDAPSNLLQNPVTKELMNDFYLSQCRVLLFCCYLLKQWHQVTAAEMQFFQQLAEHSGDEGYISSPEVTQQMESLSQKSLLHSFAVSAVIHLPKRILNIFQVLTPLLFVKRRTAHEALKLLATSQFSFLLTIIAEDCILSELQLFSSRRDSSIVMVYSICHLHDFLLMLAKPFELSSSIFLEIIRWLSQLLLGTRPRPLPINGSHDVLDNTGGLGAPPASDKNSVFRPSTNHLVVKLLNFVCDLAVRRYKEAILASTKSTSASQVAGEASGDGNAVVDGKQGSIQADFQSFLHDERDGDNSKSLPKVLTPTDPALQTLFHETKQLLVLCINILCRSLGCLQDFCLKLKEKAPCEGNDLCFDCGKQNKSRTEQSKDSYFYASDASSPDSCHLMAAGPQHHQQYTDLLRDVKALLRTTCIALRCVIYHYVVLGLDLQQHENGSSVENSLSQQPPNGTHGNSFSAASSVRTNRKISFDVRLLAYGRLLPLNTMEAVRNAFFATIGAALTYTKSVAFAASWQLQHNVNEGGDGCGLFSAPLAAALNESVVRGGGVFVGNLTSELSAGLAAGQIVEKELLEFAASVVAFLHPSDLEAFANSSVGAIYALTATRPQCISIFQFFLGHQHTCKIVSKCLIAYLLPRLPILGERRAALALAIGPTTAGRPKCCSNEMLQKEDEVFTTLREVYRQFDSLSFLSLSAEMSDLLMVALEMQLPVAGNGVFFSIPFPHISPQLVGPAQSPETAATCSRHSWPRLCMSSKYSKFPESSDAKRFSKDRGIAQKYIVNGCSDNAEGSELSFTKTLLFASGLADCYDDIVHQEPYLVCDDSFDAAILRGDRIPKNSDGIFTARVDRESAHASTALLLPYVCSGGSSSTVRSHADDFASSAAATGYCDALNTWNNLKLDVPGDAFTYPGSSIPSYAGSAKCCCCFCSTDTTRSAARQVMSDTVNPGCQCGCCVTVRYPPTSAMGCVASGKTLVRRMLALKNLNAPADDSSIEDFNVPDGANKNKPAINLAFPPLPTEHCGPHVIDTPDIVQGYEAFLQTGTAFCRMSEVATHLRLYRYLFKPIVAWKDCEGVLAMPYLQYMCRNAIYLASTSNFSHVFLSLMRVFLRQITPPGRSEHVFVAFLPLLASCLQVCAQKQDTAPKVLQDLWVEIALLTPTRLRHMLPHMSFLISPLVRALKSAEVDLVTLALRTLELWIEHLHADFLFPILTSLLQEGARWQRRTPLLSALLQVLQQLPRPAPTSSLLLSRFFVTRSRAAAAAAEAGGIVGGGIASSSLVQQQQHEKHAAMTTRILGKLGGRNRAFLKDAPAAAPYTHYQPALSIGLPFGSCCYSSLEDKDSSVRVNDIDRNRLVKPVRQGDISQGQMSSEVVQKSSNVVDEAFDAVVQLEIDSIVKLVYQLLQQADADNAAASLCYACEPLLSSFAPKLCSLPDQKKCNRRLSPNYMRQAVNALRTAVDLCDRNNNSPNPTTNNCSGFTTGSDDDIWALDASVDALKSNGDISAAKKTLEKEKQLVEAVAAPQSSPVLGLSLSICDSCIASHLRREAGRFLQQCLLMLLNFSSSLSIYWLQMVSKRTSSVSEHPKHVLQSKLEYSKNDKNNGGSVSSLPFISSQINTPLPPGVIANLRNSFPNFASDTAVPLNVINDRKAHEARQQFDALTASMLTYPLDRRRAALRSREQRMAEGMLLQPILQGLLLVAADDAAVNCREKQIRVLRARRIKEGLCRNNDKSPMDNDKIELRTCNDDCGNSRSGSDCTDSRCSTPGGVVVFLKGLMRHIALIFAGRVHPHKEPIGCAAALDEIDPALIIKGITSGLTLEFSCILPSLIAVSLLEECAATFIRTAPWSVLASCCSTFACVCCNIGVRLCASPVLQQREAGCLLLLRLLRTFPPAFSRLNLLGISQSALAVLKESEGSQGRVAAALAEEVILVVHAVACLGYRGPVRPAFLLQLRAYVSESANGLPSSPEIEAEHIKIMNSDSEMKSDDTRFLYSVWAAAEAASEVETAAAAALSDTGSAAAAAAAAAVKSKKGWAIPPPVPEYDHLSLIDRRQAYEKGYWWSKRSEFLTWNNMVEIQKGEIQQSDASSLDCIGDKGMKSLPDSQLLPCIWKFLDSLLLPNLYNLKPQCRQAMQRLLMKLASLLGTDASNLLSFDGLTMKRGNIAGSNGKANNNEQTEHNGEQNRSNNYNISVSGTSASKCNNNTPLLRILQWVTLRQFRLLSWEWQLAFIDCCCFIACLRPVPDGLMPSEHSIQATLMCIKKQKLPDIVQQADKEVLKTSQIQGEITAAFALDDASRIILWIVEDCVSLLQRSLQSFRFPVKPFVPPHTPTAADSSRAVQSGFQEHAENGISKKNPDVVVPLLLMRENVVSLLVALRFLKLAILNESWSSLLMLPRSLAQQLLQNGKREDAESSVDSSTIKENQNPFLERSELDIDAPIWQHCIIIIASFLFVPFEELSRASMHVLNILLTNEAHGMVHMDTMECNATGIICPNGSNTINQILHDNLVPKIRNFLGSIEKRDFDDPYHVGGLQGIARILKIHKGASMDREISNNLLSIVEQFLPLSDTQNVPIQAPTKTKPTTLPSDSIGAVCPLRLWPVAASSLAAIAFLDSVDAERMETMIDVLLAPPFDSSFEQTGGGCTANILEDMWEYKQKQRMLCLHSPVYLMPFSSVLNKFPNAAAYALLGKLLKPECCPSHVTIPPEWNSRHIVRFISMTRLELLLKHIELQHSRPLRLALLKYIPQIKRALHAFLLSLNSPRDSFTAFAAFAGLHVLKSLSQQHPDLLFCDFIIFSLSKAQQQPENTPLILFLCQLADLVTDFCSVDLEIKGKGFCVGNNFISQYGDRIEFVLIGELLVRFLQFSVYEELQGRADSFLLGELFEQQRDKNQEQFGTIMDHPYMDGVTYSGLVRDAASQLQQVTIQSIMSLVRCSSTSNSTVNFDYVGRFLKHTLFPRMSVQQQQKLILATFSKIENSDKMPESKHYTRDLLLITLLTQNIINPLLKDFTSRGISDDQAKILSGVEIKTTSKPVITRNDLSVLLQLVTSTCERLESSLSIHDSFCIEFMHLIRLFTPFLAFDNKAKNTLINFTWEQATRSSCLAVQHISLLVLAEISSHLKLKRSALPQFLLNAVLCVQPSPEPNLIKHATSILIPQLDKFPKGIVQFPPYISKQAAARDIDVPPLASLILKASVEVPLLYFVQIVCENERVLFKSRYFLFNQMQTAAKQLLHNTAGNSKRGSSQSVPRTDNRQSILMIVDVLVRWELRALLRSQILTMSADSEEVSYKRQRLNDVSENPDSAVLNSANRHTQKPLFARMAEKLQIARNNFINNSALDNKIFYSLIDQVEDDVDDGSSPKSNWLWDQAERQQVLQLLIKCMYTSANDSAASGVNALKVFGKILRIRPDGVIPLQSLRRFCYQAALGVIKSASMDMDHQQQKSPQSGIPQMQQQLLLGLGVLHVTVQHQAVICECEENSVTTVSPSSNCVGEEETNNGASLCSWHQLLPSVAFIIGCSSTSRNSRVTCSLQHLVSKLVLLHKPSADFLSAIGKGFEGYVTWRAHNNEASSAEVTSGTTDWWLQLPSKHLKPNDSLYDFLLGLVCAGLKSHGWKSSPAYLVFLGGEGVESELIHPHLCAAVAILRGICSAACIENRAFEVKTILIFLLPLLLDALPGISDAVTQFIQQAKHYGDSTFYSQLVPVFSFVSLLVTTFVQYIPVATSEGGVTAPWATTDRLESFASDIKTSLDRTFSSVCSPSHPLAVAALNLVARLGFGLDFALLPEQKQTYMTCGSNVSDGTMCQCCINRLNIFADAAALCHVPGGEWKQSRSSSGIQQQLLLQHRRDNLLAAELESIERRERKILHTQDMKERQIREDMQTDDFLLGRSVKGTVRCKRQSNNNGISKEILEEGPGDEIAVCDLFQLEPSAKNELLTSDFAGEEILQCNYNSVDEQIQNSIEGRMIVEEQLWRILVAGTVSNHERIRRQHISSLPTLYNVIVSLGAVCEPKPINCGVSMLKCSTDEHQDSRCCCQVNDNITRSSILFSSDDLQQFLSKLAPLTTHRRPDVALLMQWLTVAFAAAPPPLSKNLFSVTHRSTADDSSTTATGRTLESKKDTLLQSHMTDILSAPMFRCLLLSAHSVVPSLRRSALYLLEEQIVLQFEMQLNNQDLPLRKPTVVEKMLLLLNMPHWVVVAHVNLLHTFVFLILGMNIRLRGRQTRELLRDAEAPLLPSLLPRFPHAGHTLSTCEVSVLHQMIQKEQLKGFREKSQPELNTSFENHSLTPRLQESIAAYIDPNALNEYSKEENQSADDSYFRDLKKSFAVLPNSTGKLDVYLQLSSFSSNPSFMNWRRDLDLTLQKHAEFLSSIIVYPNMSEARKNSSTSLPLYTSNCTPILTDADGFALSLESLAFFSWPLTQLLFSLLLKGVWSSASRTQQQQITDGICKFLSQEGVLQPPRLTRLGDSNRPKSPRGSSNSIDTSGSVVQPFLSAILRLQPVPLLHSELLCYLGTEFKCHHECIELLQHNYLHAATAAAGAAAAHKGDTTPGVKQEKVKAIDGLMSPQTMEKDPLQTSTKLTYFDEGIIEPEPDAAADAAADLNAGKQVELPSIVLLRTRQQQQFSSAARKAGALLSEVFGVLCEDDYKLAVVGARSCCSQTAAAVALMQHQHFADAKSLLVSTLRLIEAQGLVIETEEQREEVTWWERLWIECCKELNRWNSLNELSQGPIARTVLSLQCAGKLQHWNQIERMLQTEGTPSPATKLCQCLHEILYPHGRFDGDPHLWLQPEKLQEIDRHCSEVQRLLLQSWRALPSVPSECHVPVLVQFQLYVELLEGYKLISQLCKKLQNPRDLPLTKATLNSWRERLPNSCDAIGAWNDVFVWRNFIFSIIQSCVAACPTLTPSQRALWPGYLQDMPWTMLKFASVARSKHNLRDISLVLLLKLQSFASFNQQAYAQEHLLALVEKVKLCAAEPQNWVLALQLINSMNMESFCNINTANGNNSATNYLNSLNANPSQNKQQRLQQHGIQIFKLKAVILFKMYMKNNPQYHTGMSRESLISEAESALKTALTLQPLYGGAWLTYGRLHDLLFTAAMKQQQEQQQSDSFRQAASNGIIDGSANLNGAGGDPTAPAEGFQTNTLELMRSHLAAAILGYLMDVQLRPAKSLLHLNRALWLLSYERYTRNKFTGETKQKSNDTPTETPLCFQVFRLTLSKCTQPLLLMPWVPHFLTGLERPEGAEMERLLYIILLHAPQQLYFDLRTAYFERREVYAHQRLLNVLKPSQNQATEEKAPDAQVNAHPPQQQEQQQQQQQQQQQRQQQSLSHLSRLMSVFRTSFTPQCIALDHLTESLLSHAKPSTVDEILCAICTLSQQCVEIAHTHTRLPAVAAQFLRLNVLSRFKQRYSGEEEVPSVGNEKTNSKLGKDWNNRCVRSNNLKRNQSDRMGMWSTCSDSASKMMRSLWPSFKRDFGFVLNTSRESQEDVETYFKTINVTDNGSAASATKNERGEETIESVPLCEVIARLKRWKDLLSRRTLTDDSGSCLPDLSASLGEVLMRVNIRIELPAISWLQVGDAAVAAAATCSDGGFAEHRQPLYVERFETDCALVTRSHYMLRRVGMIASNGALFHFLVQPYSTAHQRTEQRLMSLLLMFNRLLHRFKGTRAKGLAFPVNALVPMHPRCRLLEDRPSQVSLQQILSECGSNAASIFKLDPDVAVLLHRQLLRRRLPSIILTQALQGLRRNSLNIAAETEHARPRLPQALISLIEGKGFAENEEDKQILQQIQTILATGSSRNNIKPSHDAQIPNLAPIISSQNDHSLQTQSAQQQAGTAPTGNSVTQTTNNTPIPSEMSETQQQSRPVNSEKEQREQRWLIEFHRSCQLRASQDVYDQLCTLVSDRVLRHFIFKTHCGDSQQLFLFQKQMVKTHGLSCILNYSLSMADISPSKIILDLSSGQVTQLELKAAYTGSSLTLDFSERVPFRLTRNLEVAMGPFGRSGLLPAAMYAFVNCMHEHSQIVQDAASLLIRDDVTFLHKQKQQQQHQKLLLSQQKPGVSAGAAAASADTTEAVRRVIEVNTSRILDVISRMHCSPAGDENSKESFPLDHQIQLLLALASRRDILCMMRPTWQAWF